MAVAWRLRWRPLLSTVIIAALAGHVMAKSVAQLSVPEIEDAIQVGTHSIVTQKRKWLGCELQKLTVRRDAL